MTRKERRALRLLLAAGAATSGLLLVALFVKELA
jgi:hypothetical protein